jgi:hypothetical protein
VIHRRQGEQAEREIVIVLPSHREKDYREPRAFFILMALGVVRFFRSNDPAGRLDFSRRSPWLMRQVEFLLARNS